MEREGIDFVITWVDGNDPAWQKEKAKYRPQTEADDRPERYRDWEFLPYWFRGVERYAPWVRRIHFITCGQIPDWMNTSHPKLHLVSHEDYIPREYLPTFSSRVIELHMHRIEGLSERFVYFNDDFLPVRDLKPTDFFDGDRPCDMLAFQPVVANPANPVMSHSYLNNTLVLARHFDKRQNVRMQPGHYFKIGYPPLYFFYNFLELAFPLFTGFYTVHGPFPFLKSTFEEVWEKEGEVLRETSSHRFRGSEDVTPYLLREWQKLTGNFTAKNITRDLGYFNVGNENEKLLRAIRKRKSKIICINDANQPIAFERVKRELLEAFDEILPQKSSFEK
ncbi:MAG: stealth family protein [Lachnospiraceae bacterium]|nr:stealth family protein [Lachnospiraceae bacterium]